MDRRRRAGAIAASAAAVSASTGSLLATHHDPTGNSPGDFAAGIVIGLVIVMIGVALVLIARSRGGWGCP